MARSVGIRRKTFQKVKSQKLSWADAPPNVITKILSKFDSSAMTLAKAATCRRWRVARSSGDMQKYVFTIPDTPFLKKEVKFIKQLDGSLKEIKITGVMKNEKVLRDFLDLLGALLKIVRKFKPKIERLDFSGLQTHDPQIWSKLPPRRFWDKKARHWARRDYLGNKESEREDIAEMRAEGENDFIGRNGIRIGPYHDAFAELFYFLTTAPFLRGCVRNNLKYISFEDCKLPPRGVGNIMEVLPSAGITNYYCESLEEMNLTNIARDRNFACNGCTCNFPDYWTLLNCFGPQNEVSQDDEEFSSLLKTISIDGKWLHPSVIFGLRRHKNLKKLNLKLNSDGAIPRDGWSDLSIDELIEHNEKDKDDWNRVQETDPECLDGVFKMFSALEICHDLEIKLEITEDFLIGENYSTDIRFLMNGIEDFLTELSIVTNTAPCIDPFWMEDDNLEHDDECDIRFILENSKKIKKLKIHILEDMDAGPYLVSTLQSLVFPKFEKLEHLSISAFLTFENLMKLRDSLHKNVEELNLNNLELVELDIKAYPKYTDEQLNILQGLNSTRKTQNLMPKIIVNLSQLTISYELLHDLIA